MDKYVVSLWLASLFFLAGLLTGEVLFLYCTFAFLLFPLFTVVSSIIVRDLSERDLPEGILRVDGHERTFRYLQVEGDRFTLYKTPDPQSLDKVIFTAFSSSEKESIPPAGIIVEGEPDRHGRATVIFSGKEFTFDVQVHSSQRCPCGANPPCWTGTMYVGRFEETVDETVWLGYAFLLVFDQQQRRKRRLKLGELLRGQWNKFHFPDLKPFPV